MRFKREKGKNALAMWSVILTVMGHINGQLHINGEVQVMICLVTVKIIKLASRSGPAGVIFVYHVR